MSRRHTQLDAEDGEITDLAGSSQSAKATAVVTLNGHKPAASLASASKREYSRSRSPSRNRYAERRTSERHGGYSRHIDRNRSRSPRQGDHKSRRDDKVARVSTNEPNVSMPSLPPVLSSSNDTARVDESVPLYLDYEDEEADTERLLEARRRRRREILLMHEAQNPAQSASVADVKNLSIIDNESGDPSTGGSVSLSAEIILEKKGIVDSSAAKPSTSSSNDLPAADYSPNADMNADDVRHRIAAQAMMAKASVAAVSTAPIADEDDDEFDMFAEDDDLIARLQEAKPKGGVAAAATASAMVDDWDDAEGYYRTNIGELLDDRYLVQAFLGQGVFSSVVKAIDTRNNNAPVAVKIIRQNETMYKAGTKEKKMLERLEAADPSGKMHVVRLLGSFVHREHLCLCFELMSLNLREVVRKYGRDSGLSLQAVKVYATHLLLALDLLRRCEIVHGDLKPDNCFVSELRNNVKLGDLGSASDVSENELTPYLVSRFYRAPEVILGIPHDCAIDMWSLGVTLFELYTGKILFPGKSNNNMLRLMMEARGHFANKMLRRGQLWNQHFEDNGGNLMDFVSRSHDRLANAEIAQRMVFTKPTQDVKTRILQATPEGSTPEDIQQALQFASLLDRCLELSPDKRATPMEALRHPFFAQK
ncbi:U4/U6 small nuclear ribonucleoprotein prp4 [Coemansia aciculifera]|uniref:non-specific serine/threonine protein kinase n=1 Tax=Coemansia aciculifera TaxID=417176 RepID=A0A9W8IKV6_9FUNG|nr:U4/U6 small nuclear ribonucleoprotein prp4 [Coemansia aciculifera]